MIKKFTMLSLIFATLNILCAETKVKAEMEQNYFEVNDQNIKYLKAILTQSGLTTADLQSEVLNYLNEYKCIKSFECNPACPEIKCALPNDSMIIECNNGIQIIDINGNVTASIKDDERRMSCFCALENNLIAVGYNITGVVFYNGNQFKEYSIEIYDYNFNFLGTLGVHEEPIKCLCEFPGNRLASGSLDHTIKIWDTDSAVCIKTLEGHNFIISHLKYLQNGMLVSAYQDGVIQIWDIDSGKCISTLKGFLLSVLPNNRLAIMEWGKIKIWDNNSKEYICTLVSHLVKLLRPLSNKLVVSVTDDMQIWDIDSRKYLQTLEDKKVSSICALSNGKFASITKNNGSVIMNIWAPMFHLIEK